MKEAFGSYFLTMIFILFVVLFTGYMCLSINMNKAYKVKNEIINTIQKNNGLTEDALAQIRDYMSKVGYRTTGDCGAWDGFGVSQNSSKPVFCVKKMQTEYEAENEYVDEQFPKSAYFQVRVFFGIDLPVIRSMFTFGVNGSTKKMFYPCQSSYDDKESECVI